MKIVHFVNEAGESYILDADQVVWIKTKDGEHYSIQLTNQSIIRGLSKKQADKFRIIMKWRQKQEEENGQTNS